jgi:hypothetical protein
MIAKIKSTARMPSTKGTLDLFDRGAAAGIGGGCG